MNTKISGVVKRWYDGKGYGFVAGEDKKDYFIHYTNIISDRGYKKLFPKDKVEFIPGENDKGGFATELVVIEPAKRYNKKQEEK